MSRDSTDVLQVSLDVSAVPARPAGAGRYILELATALAKLPDCGLTLVARSDDGARWARVAPNERVRAVVPGPRLARLLYEQARLGATLASLTAPPVEVHHGPHYTMPLRSKLPCVVTVHDLTFFDHPEWHERSKVAWFRAATRYSARHAAAIVCVSEATAERLGELLAPRCPVVVVGHGVDGDRFAAEEPGPGLDRQVLARLGLDRPYVLHVGTMEPRKGIADLVAAFERLAGDRTDLELVLAGGVGWGGGPVDAVDRGFAGRRPDPPPWLRRRRRCPGPAPRGERCRLSVARGGFRAAGPRGAGVRCPARHDRRHAHGRDRWTTARSSSPPVSLSRWRRRSRRRSRPSPRSRVHGDGPRGWP